MSPFSWLNILLLSSKNNPNLQTDFRCPLCNERYRIVRHGHYWRNGVGSTQDRIAVQRYCCGNPDCPRKTFSILPAALLPYCRIPLCMLLKIYARHHAKGLSVNQCARLLSIGWNAARRGLTLARRILDMVRRELTAGALPPTPSGHGAWQTFIRTFSYAFFPGQLIP